MSAAWQVFKLTGYSQGKLRLQPERPRHFLFLRRQSGEPRARDGSGILRRASANQANQTPCYGLGSCGEKKFDKSQYTEAREEGCAAAYLSADGNELSIPL